MERISRRDLLKYRGAAVAGLVVSSEIPWISDNPVYAAVRNINFTITDGLKNMVTQNANNTAQCSL